MKKIKSFNEFLNEQKDVELNESFLNAVKKYALKLALDPKVQDAMLDVVQAITGKTISDAFSAMKNKLKRALGEPIDDLEDLPGDWRRNDTLSSEEESRDFVEDYMAASTVKREAPNAPMNIQLNLNSDAKAIFGGTDEELKAIQSKMIKD